MRCLGLDPAEDVLVVFNEDQRVIAESLAMAAEGTAQSVHLLGYPTLTRDGEEPPETVASAMANADVVFAPTNFSLSHTRASIEATQRGTRIATLPGITEAVFKRAMPVDYADLGRAGIRWLARRLRPARRPDPATARGRARDRRGRGGRTLAARHAGCGWYHRPPGGRAWHRYESGRDPQRQHTRGREGHRNGPRRSRDERVVRRLKRLDGPHRRHARRPDGGAGRTAADEGRRAARLGWLRSRVRIRPRSRPQAAPPT